MVRFITFTLDPKTVKGDPWVLIRGLFKEFQIYCRRKKVSFKYIRVLARQPGTGLPHFHFLIDTWMNINWVRKTWVKLGGGPQILIELVEAHRIAKYLSKYLADNEIINLPKGTRRVSTSKGIKLFEKIKSTWRHVRLDIEYLRALAKGVGILLTEKHEEGELNFFITSESLWEFIYAFG